MSKKCTAKFSSFRWHWPTKFPDEKNITSLIININVIMRGHSDLICQKSVGPQFLAITITYILFLQQKLI